MRLSDYTLTERQIEKIDLLMKLIDKHEYLKEELRTAFREHISGLNGEVDMSPLDMSRLMKNPASRKYQRIVLLVDFLFNSFLPFGLEEKHVPFTDKYNDVYAAYQEIKDDMGTLFTRSVDPFESVFGGAGVAGQRVPKKFFKQYIGYRRSSKKGEVVRFHLQINRSKEDDKVIFSNEYFRMHSHWKVDGVGLYWSQILYLFGFAKHHYTEESLGYRFFALQQLQGSDVLTGPIVSMDNAGPISARVVLVPLERHNLNFEQSQLSKSDLIDYMINPSSSTNVSKYIAEIKTNLKPAFEGHEDNYIFKLISNLTLSTVRALPDENDRLVEQELRFRKVFHEAGRDLETVNDPVVRALKKAQNKDILG